jgi:hypothetical protein
MMCRARNTNRSAQKKYKKLKANGCGYGSEAVKSVIPERFRINGSGLFLSAGRI